MNAIDASDHYTKESTETPAALLNVIIDTNPHAWAYLHPTLPLSRAVAALLVFLNAHLAFHNTNRIAVIASHAQRAEFLYPAPPAPPAASHAATNGAEPTSNGDAHDTPMADAASTATAGGAPAYEPANFYRPFANLAAGLTARLARLIDSTPADALTLPPTTSFAGALTLALTHTHKVGLGLAGPGASAGGAAGDAAAVSEGKLPPNLTARILVLSTTPASPAQYIPLMNAIFAAQRLRVPIDVLALNPAPGAASASTTAAHSGGSDASPFLQQAATTTGGTHLALTHPHGLLQTLMQGFLAMPPARGALVPPAQAGVDFRAACFCHRRVVDVGYVCSVCLSIFCEPPEDATCLTCGTHLRLGGYGRSPVVVRRRKKRRREEGGTPGGGTPAR